MANTLKAWLTDNTVTADPNDKILVLESTGKADLDKVLEEMQAEDTGLRPETQAHVVALFQRKCARLRFRCMWAHLREISRRNFDIVPTVAVGRIVLLRVVQQPCCGGRNRAVASPATALLLEGAGKISIFAPRG